MGILLLCYVHVVSTQTEREPLPDENPGRHAEQACAHWSVFAAQQQITQSQDTHVKAPLLPVLEAKTPRGC